MPKKSQAAGRGVRTAEVAEQTQGRGSRDHDGDRGRGRAEKSSGRNSEDEESNASTGPGRAASPPPSTVRVLVVTPAFPPGMHVGGGVAVTYKVLTEKLAARPGCTVNVLSTWNGRLDYMHLGFDPEFRFILPSRRNLRIIQQAMDQADVVVFPDTMIFVWLAMETARRGKPAVWAIHTNIMRLAQHRMTAVEHFFFSGIVRRLFVMQSRVVTRVLTTSRDYLDYLLAQGMKLHGYIDQGFKTDVFRQPDDPAVIENLRQQLAGGRELDNILIGPPQPGEPAPRTVGQQGNGDDAKAMPTADTPRRSQRLAGQSSSAASTDAGLAAAAADLKRAAAVATATANRGVTSASAKGRRRPIMVFAGRFSNEKRIHLLIKAKPADFVLVLIGDGYLRDQLLELHDPVKGIVVIPHMLPQAELRRFYKAADMIVSASDFETYGMTIHEALLCGRPVVVQDAKGFRFQVRDGVNGFLIDYADSVAAAAALERALSHKFDPKPVADPNCLDFVDTVIQTAALKPAPLGWFTNLFYLIVQVAYIAALRFCALFYSIKPPTRFSRLPSAPPSAKPKKRA